MAKKKEDKAKAPYQKQRANIYTMMLIMAFLFLTLGCFVLYRELDGSYRNEKGEIDYYPQNAKSTLLQPAPSEALGSRVA